MTLGIVFIDKNIIKLLYIYILFEIQNYNTHVRYEY